MSAPHWLVDTWNSTWPNLLANVLWVPVAWLHHKRMKHHLARAVDEIRAGQPATKE